MTGIRIYLDGDKFGQQFRRATERYGDKVRSAVRGAALDAAEEIEEKGREDIASAGNFGSRWTEGLKATVTEGGGNIRINVTEDVSYWRIFQEGGTIEGNPLLFIPFSDSDAQGVSAKDYPSPLFRVDRLSDGLPILFAWSPGTKEPPVATYFGKESVFEPKRFHLVEIAQEVARELPELYNKRLSG